MSLTLLFTFVLVLLKLLSFISISRVWVFSPIWIGAILWVLMVILASIVNITLHGSF